MKHFLFSLTLITLGLSACKNNGCNQPYAFNYDPDGTSTENCVYGPLQLNVNVTPTFNGVEIDDTTPLADQTFMTEDGREISFDFFGIYLTEISARVNGEYKLLDLGVEDCLARSTDAALITNEVRVYQVSILPDENFDLTGLRFNIGVDECRNDSLDPTTKSEGPFMPQANSMYWSWTSGYRFIRLDGTVDGSENADGSLMAEFQYHTGTNMLLRSVSLEFDNVEPVDGKLVINVELDLAVMLKGLDFTQDWVTHTMNNMPLAVKISDNATEAFTLKE